jgi:hypothetical protein
LSGWYFIWQILNDIINMVSSRLVTLFWFCVVHYKDHSCHIHMVFSLKFNIFINIPSWLQWVERLYKNSLLTNLYLFYKSKLSILILLFWDKVNQLSWWDFYNQNVMSFLQKFITLRSLMSIIICMWQVSSFEDLQSCKQVNDANLKEYCIA